MKTDFRTVRKGDFLVVKSHSEKPRHIFLALLEGPNLVNIKNARCICDQVDVMPGYSSFCFFRPIIKNGLCIPKIDINFYHRWNPRTIGYEMLSTSDPYILSRNDYVLVSRKPEKVLAFFNSDFAFYANLVKNMLSDVKYGKRNKERFST